MVEAAVAGATLAAGAAIWLLVGYLIQRFAFRKSRTDLRYRLCNIIERFNVAVFSRRFADVSHPIRLSRCG